VTKLGDCIATDAVDHNEKGDIKGLDSIKAILASIHKMGTDMKMTVTKELADNDYVFAWEHYTGTSNDPSMGMPVGAKYDMNAIQVSRMKDGKVAEHWEFMQPAEMMKMMANMNMAPKMDSAHMNK
jgi:predicted SnoaL-like aldol condensation-catalyzing enzyme